MVPEKKIVVENKQHAYARAAGSSFPRPAAWSGTDIGDAAAASGDPETLALYEAVMEDWCVHCEKLLAESEQLEADNESG